MTPKAQGRLGREQLELIDAMRRRAIEIMNSGKGASRSLASEIVDMLEDVHEMHLAAPVGHGYDRLVNDYILRRMSAIRRDRSLAPEARKASLAELGRVQDYVRRRRR